VERHRVQSLAAVQELVSVSALYLGLAEPVGLSASELLAQSQSVVFDPVKKVAASWKKPPGNWSLLVVHTSGTPSLSSWTQTSESTSAGARQSLRGDNEPPDPTFGVFGRHDRLNWLKLKKRYKNTSSHFLMVGNE
jgi:hypothetical protein